MGDNVIWNASTGEIVQLMSMDEPEEYNSSVKWIKEGNILGLGNSSGNVQVRLLTGEIMLLLLWNVIPPMCLTGSLQIS